MELSRQQVLKVASLARLKLTDEEARQIGRQLAVVLGYIEKLGEVETTGIEPLAHCLPVQNVFRPDETRPSLPADEALANAPKRTGDFYAVPSILD